MWTERVQDRPTTTVGESALFATPQARGPLGHLQPTSTLTRRPFRAVPVANRHASVGLLLGAISVVVNPLFLTSIASFVLSGMGISRARRQRVNNGRSAGKKRGAWGIVLACVGIVVSSVVTSLVFTAILRNSLNLFGGFSG